MSIDSIVYTVEPFLYRDSILIYLSIYIYRYINIYLILGFNSPHVHLDSSKSGGRFFIPPRSGGSDVKLAQALKKGRKEGWLVDPRCM